MEPLLQLDGFGVAFGEQVVLAQIDLALAHRGAMVLMGPGGAGKSTLLRTVAGVTTSQPSFRSWGTARYLGAPLGEGPQPGLVMQHARLLMSSLLENLICELPQRTQLGIREQRAFAAELLARSELTRLTRRLDDNVIDLPLGVQRMIAVLRGVAADQPLLCIDEPTMGLADDAAAEMMTLLRNISEERAILMITHNQRHARALSGRTALLAGGRIIEEQPTEIFFTAPRTSVAKNYVRTGSCAVPSPTAESTSLADDVEPPPPPPAAALKVPSASRGPRGFRWVKPGRLGGLPRPGITTDAAWDLEALRRVGVDTLVTLEMEPFDGALLAEHGIQGRFFPVEDMHAPDLAAAATFCSEIDQALREGRVVALHCRAGMGRTGTMLAAQLVWDGQSARQALEAVRQIDHRWVQSQQQVDFLRRFADYIGDGTGDRPSRIQKNFSEGHTPIP